MSKTILITGASTGFGRDVAETQISWRAVTAPFRGFIEVRRVRRERETYHALSRLSDHLLKDAGISRSEIGSIAQSTAAAASKQRDRLAS